MKRREFITLLGGSAVTLSTAVRAQQPATPLIGFLHPTSPETKQPYLAAFHRGLGDTGFVESKNVAGEYRWAQGQNDRLPTLVAELVRLHPPVIAVLESTAGALAAKAATQTIPIVFLQGADPVRIGLVSSLNHPGGNLTGICLAAADALSLRLLPVAASRLSEIEVAFEHLVEQRADALFVSSDGFLLTQSNQIVALAAKRRMPSIYGWREAGAFGGLISYGTNFLKTWRQAGVYTGRILNGEKPSDLPVTQPTSFELAINLSTAKALGITVPLTLLAQADELNE
jgi:putative tryptophan/tyrosine transport system substrate-binding protein